MGILVIIWGNLYEKFKKELLTVERIRLEREEKLKIAEIERLSQHMKLLLDKSNNATERLGLERQIKEFEQKIQKDNIHLEIISDQIRVVNNLIGWRSGFDNLGAKLSVVEKSTNSDDVYKKSTHFGVCINPRTSVPGYTIGT